MNQIDPPPPGVAAAIAHRLPDRRRLRPRSVPFVSSFLFALYSLPSWRLKQFLRWLLHRIEGGSMFSITLRRIFRRFHGIEVGDFTHGGWIVPFHLDEGTVVGRYSSLADTVRTVTHNHPLATRSTSGLFFNPFFGIVPENTAPRTKLVIGNDVWIGHYAIILPSVRSIGDGAVIGAGAVVGRDVPPFAIVHGNPARVVGYRFSPEKIAELLAEQWWHKPLEQLCDDLAAFRDPLEDERARLGSA